MRLDRRTLIAGSLAITAIGFAGKTSAQSSPWTLLDDAGGPIARWDHALLADPEGKRLYLFGGRDGNGGALGDLWVFDLESGGWNQADVAGPAARFGVAAASTPDNSGFILFGGQSADVFFNDTWAFDYASGSWTLLDDGSGVAPSPRYGLGGDFDAGGRFIVSHGFTFEGRFDDTWEYDFIQGAWTDISPPAETRPLRRCLHELSAVDGGARLLLYAGCSSGYGPCPQGDLWSLDVASDTWTQLFPDVAPAPRSNPAVRATGSEIVMIGGLTESGPAADVWLGQLGDLGLSVE